MKRCKLRILQSLGKDLKGHCTLGSVLLPFFEPSYAPGATPLPSCLWAVKGGPVHSLGPFPWSICIEKIMGSACQSEVSSSTVHLSYDFLPFMYPFYIFSFWVQNYTKLLYHLNFPFCCLSLYLFLWLDYLSLKVSDLHCTKLLQG